MRGMTVRRVVLGLALAALGSVASVRAGTTWTSAGSGYWTNPATWSGSGIPADGDDAVILSGHGVTADVSSAVLNNFTNNGTLTFSGWNTVLTAAVVAVSGSIRHFANTDIVGTLGVYSDWTPDNRVWIVCSNLTVSSGGGILADGSGYKAGIGAAGYGPGGGAIGSGGNSAGGGGYGGRGGNVYSKLSSWNGVEYGSSNAPVDPGSGGSGNVGGAGRNGGNGGGAIRIEASGDVLLDGSISANGNGAAGYGSAGGSGGGIWITCRTLTGAGTISTKGGSGQNQGNGGSGGRIAVAYNPSAQASAANAGVVFSTLGGNPGSSVYEKGTDGTVFFPDTLPLRSVITETLRGVRLFGFTNWATPFLTVSNWSVAFAEPWFALSVTNGNLVLTNGGALGINAGATNAIWTNAGAQVSVSGDLIVGTNCWVYPLSNPTLGGSVQFLAANLAVLPGGGFNADYAGYPGGVSGSPYFGYGPGGGKADANGAGGGGYGGNGGNPAVVNTTNYGFAYGSEALPLSPGSGGAGNSGGGSGRPGGNGGGLIWIAVTNRISLDGQMTVKGQDGPNYSAGGSGGGIYLSCRTISGTNGYLIANGGNGANGSGGGGGGRIAIQYLAAAQTEVAPVPALRLSAAPGSSTVYGGNPGTLYLVDASFFPTPVIRDSGSIVIPGFTNWMPASLLVTNAWVRFRNVDIVATGAVTIVGASGRADLSGTASLAGQDVTLTNSSQLRIYAAVTNASRPDYGTWVSAAGNMVVDTNCWVYPLSDTTSPGSVLFRMKNLTVNSNAGFNASNAGYAGGNPGANGSGPGRGYGSGIGPGGGGGYGGTGGYASVTYGLTYGSSNTPVDVGSGGGGVGGGTDRIGGAGGGLVRIETSGTLTLSGALRANGQTAAGWAGGGGAGGSVYIRCRKLAGVNGAVSANGGNPAANSSYGGGGGRIAIWRMIDAWSGLSVTANGGTGSQGGGGMGTVYWRQIPLPGTVVMFR